MKRFWSKFLEIVALHPMAAAIEEDGKTVTYAELAAKAAAIGRSLKKKGVAAETPVALELEKSADYVASLLGCWYAGAAFVPLPPSLPQERRDHILRHADIRHSITAYDLRAVQPGPGTLRPAEMREDTLAYIIYTSGSTGAPKGVMVEHRGIVPFLEAQVNAFGLGPGSRALFYLSILFDAAISDIGTALLSGATLLIPPSALMRDGALFVKELHSLAVTHMDVPPSLLKALLPESMPDSLETVIIGGEACPPGTVRRWAEKFRIINVYGPTEATVCTSLCLCDAEKWDTPLIGDPLPGVDYLILDESGDTAAEGELHIGGDCLARGYLKDPMLTAGKFVQRAGRRLYRTGDRVRRRADGAIEFFGRIDRQFKLRGQLVEPEEVEAKLLSHPAVRKAAVMKREERLVAFLAAAEETPVPGLVALLKKSLPAWMIPQDFIFPNPWPLTPTGKTDHTALASLRPAAAARKRAAAATETERRIHAIWREILKHDDFGIDDDFFSVGGDSLDLIRMTLEAERHGLYFSAGTLAACRTIEKLARETGKQADAVHTDRLKKDVAFDPEWQEIFNAARLRPPMEDAPPQAIFLTGAAGFLGGRILHALLEKTGAPVHCLVRAGDERHALGRIEKSLRRFLPDIPPALLSRVRPVCGDLSLPRFGLAQEAWEKLSRETDAVYHCAAAVNMVLPYADLRPANVTATQEILRFCCAGKRKRLHHASTLSVFVATDRNRGRLMETDRLEDVQTVYGGYAQTKWAAEWMLLQVPKNVCDIRHYRFGLITGDTATGAASDMDFLAMFAKGTAALRVAPEGFDDTLFVDVTPVDYAAKAMAQLSICGTHDIYHIANPESLSLGRLLSAIGRKRGPLHRLPAPRWKDVAENIATTAAETAARLSLCRCLPETFAQNRVMDLFQATDVIFDTTHADAVLGFSCPPASDALLDLYMDFVFRDAPAPLRICIFGPESTGKSTLAENLAAHFKTAFVPEYAKELIFAQDGKIEAGDIPVIARGQRRSEAEALARANRLLFCDTDLITTAIWSGRLFGNCPQWIRDAAQAQDYALYLLMDIDTPWVADLHRYLPNERATFLAKCRAELEQRGIKYVLLSGTWREKHYKATSVVNDTLSKL